MSNLKYASTTDYTNSVLAFTTACLVCATGVTSARCTMRYSKKIRLGLDDAFAIVGYLALVVVLIANFVVATSGSVSNRPLTAEVEQRLKIALIACLIGFSVAMSCGKLSLLFLYRRIFGMRETWFRYAWWTVFIFSGPIFTTISWVFVGLQIARGREVDQDDSQMIQVIIVSFICACSNLAILILPVGTISVLQLDRSKKIGLIFIFSLGSLGSATAFLRTGRTVQSLVETWDPRYKRYEDAMMDVGEATALILCASLPLIRPLLVKVKDFTLWSLQSVSMRSSRKSSLRSSSTKGTSDDELQLKGGIVCRTDYEVSEVSASDSEK